VCVRAFVFANLFTWAYLNGTDGLQCSVSEAESDGGSSRLWRE